MLFEVALRIVHFGRGDLGVVRVDWWKVRQYAGAVEALPPEGRVGEQVLLVPTQLLGDEPRATSLAEDLRQCRRVPEHVGDPHLRTARAEPRLEVTLTEHELANDALAARQVHVGLDPHPTDGMPLAGRHLLADALEQRRVVAFYPIVLGGLRTSEPVLGVVVHQAHCRRKGARAFAL